MAGQRQPIELLLAKGKKNLTKKEIEEGIETGLMSEEELNKRFIAQMDKLFKRIKNEME